MATLNCFSAAYGDVNAVINGGIDSNHVTWPGVSDGDTVIIPAGTASWTQDLVVSKNITILGATTTNTTSGTGSATDSTGTVLLDNIPGTGPNPDQCLIRATSIANNGFTFRVSGITFKYGTVSRMSIAQPTLNLVGVWGGSPASFPSIRIDHCHFNQLQDYCLQPDGVFGVVDHCIFDGASNVTEWISTLHSSWGGVGNYGDASWNNPTNFGSANFLFWENNCFNNVGGTSTTNGAFDCFRGGRFVLRHNIWNDTRPANHGTESNNRGRSARAFEIYNETFNFTNQTSSSGSNLGQWRGGTGLFFNNTFRSTRSPLNYTVKNYRSTNSWYAWGGVTGGNAWDVWDTEGNGTYVSGHSPHVYFTGTQTGATSSTLLTDTGQSWTTNQATVVGGTIFDTTVGSAGGVGRSGNNGSIGLITSNSSNTATFVPDVRPPETNLTLNGGDSYSIYRALVALDQCGRGKGDLVADSSPNNGVPVNTNSGNTVAWPHDALEPIYEWGNTVNGSGVALITSDNTAQLAQNRDYYNTTAWAVGNDTIANGVGVGTLAQRPHHCMPGNDLAGGSSVPGVAYWETDQNQLDYCVATDTWTTASSTPASYTPYQYPHPLVSGGGGSQTGNPTVSIFSPASGQVLSGTFTIQATASSPFGVAGVQFTIDGTDYGGPDPTAPYSIPWGTTAFSNTSHSISAIVSDISTPPLTAIATPVSVTVNNGPIFTSGTSATFVIPTFSSFTVTVTGLPATLALTTGTLPSGITFFDNGNNTATLGGTPFVGTPGTYPLLFTATNSTGPSTQNFTLTVATPATPVITSPLSASGTVGLPFNYQIAASNNPTSFNATGLPLGLTVSTTTGLISGTPKVVGVDNITLNATALGETGSATLVLTVGGGQGGTGGGIQRVPNAPENVSVIARRI